MFSWLFHAIFELCRGFLMGLCVFIMAVSGLVIVVATPFPLLGIAAMLVLGSLAIRRG